MVDRFEEILQQFGKMIELQLHVDQAGACSIQVKEGLILTMQPDREQEHLWLFCKIIEVEPGKFRDNVLHEALKANGGADPRAGVFGWIQNTGELALFQKYPLPLLNGEILSGLIGAFLAMAQSWKEAIKNGQSAPTKG